VRRTRRVGTFFAYNVVLHANEVGGSVVRGGGSEIRGGGAAIPGSPPPI